MRRTLLLFTTGLVVLLALPTPGDESPLSPLADGQRAAIAEALQDEYQGQAVYARVLSDHGDVRPFANVVHAEARHASLLVGLLETRGLPVPANRWEGAEVEGYASRAEACAAAVDFEVKNVALYDRLLASDDLPDDVREVFEHNRMASLEHHKPAFERCASGGGRGRGQGAMRGRGHGRGGRGCGHGGEARGRGPGATSGGCCRGAGD